MKGQARLAFDAEGTLSGIEAIQNHPKPISNPVGNLFQKKGSTEGGSGTAAWWCSAAAATRKQANDALKQLAERGLRKLHDEAATRSWSFDV